MIYVQICPYWTFSEKLRNVQSHGIGASTTSLKDNHFSEVNRIRIFFSGGQQVLPLLMGMWTTATVSVSCWHRFWRPKKGGYLPCPGFFLEI